MIYAKISYELILQKIFTESILITIIECLLFQKRNIITGFGTRVTQCVPLVGHELLILQGHLISPPVVSGVHVTRSMVLYLCFIDLCLSFWTLCFLSSDIRILITHLVSVSSSKCNKRCSRRHIMNNLFERNNTDQPDYYTTCTSSNICGKRNKPENNNKVFGNK